MMSLYARRYTTAFPSTILFAPARSPLRRSDFFDRQTAAKEISVAISIVDASNDRPKFMFAGPKGWVGCRLAGIGVLPIFHQQILGGMRCTLEQIILLVRLPGFDRPNFAENRRHCIAKTI